MSKQKCCKTCAYAKWWRTPSGRIKQKTSGKCQWREPALVVPAVVTVTFSRIAVWPESGAECPTWEAAQQQQGKDGA